MFINNLKIKNFKTIKDLDLNFKKINLISGENGEGKSSLLESIVFLLSNHLEGRIKDYVNWDAKEFEILTNFNYINKNFNYSIKAGKTTSRKLIINNDELNPFLNSDATEELAKVIDPKIILYSNISLQGKSTQLLFEDPTARLEKLKFIFGMDKINEAVEKMKNDISENKEKIKIIEAELQILKAKKFEIQDEFEIEDYSNLESEIEKLEEKKNEILIEIERCNDIFNNLTKQKHNFEIEKNEKEKEKIKVENNIENYKSISGKITLLNSKINEYEKKLEDYVIKRIKPCDYTESEIKEHNDCYIEISRDIKILEDKLKLTKNGKCPTCGQDYKISSVEELENNIKEKNKELIYINESLQTIKNSIEEYKTKNNENEKIKIQRNNLQSLIDDKKKEIKELQNIKKPDESKINELVMFLNGVETKISNIETEIKSLVKPEYDDTLLNKKKELLLINRQKEKELERIKEFNLKVKKEEKENNKIIIDKETELNTIRNNNIILESSRKKLGKDFSSYLIERRTDFIKSKMNSIFSRSYGRYNVTLERDNKGVDFLYSSPGKKVTPVVLASGYEKQALSISFRFALSYLQNLGLFLFDEIDSDSSEENSLRLFKVILNEPSIEQMFIITHKENTKEYLKNLNECKMIEI